MITILHAKNTNETFLAIFKQVYANSALYFLLPNQLIFAFYFPKLVVFRTSFRTGI